MARIEFLKLNLIIILVISLIYINHLQKNEFNVNGYNN